MTMRLIDADALREEISSLTMTITGLRAEKGVLREFLTEYRKSVLRIIDEAPTIEAKPVRNEGTTTYIDVDDIDKVQTRIVLTENKKSKFCRVFYEDDREHGRWVNPHMNRYGHPCHHCSECDFLASQKDRNFYPHCGAKMDAKEA